MFPDAFAALEARAFPTPWHARAFEPVAVALSLWLEDTCICFVYGRQILDELEIDRVATHPGHRRLGLARRLLEELRTRAPILGLSQVFLEVAAGNAAALALYERVGFQRTGLRRAYYRDGEDAVLMTWVL